MNKKTKIVLHALSIVMGLVGYGLVVYCYSWKLAVAISLIHYSINLARSAEKADEQ